MPLHPDTHSLASVAETAFRALFHAGTRAEFDSVFNGLVAERATITMNGQPVAREHYREHLWRDQMFGHGAARLTFKEVVDVPRDTRNPIPEGDVGMFYEADVAERNGTNELKIRVSVNITFERLGVSHSTGGLEAPFITSLSQVSNEFNPLKNDG